MSSFGTRNYIKEEKLGSVSKGIQSNRCQEWRSTWTSFSFPLFFCAQYLCFWRLLWRTGQSRSQREDDNVSPGNYLLQTSDRTPSLLSDSSWRPSVCLAVSRASSGPQHRKLVFNWFYLVCWEIDGALCKNLVQWIKISEPGVGSGCFVVSCETAASSKPNLLQGDDKRGNKIPPAEQNTDMMIVSALSWFAQQPV